MHEWDVEHRCAAPALLPLISLSLIEESVFRRRDELLCDAAVAAVVRFVATSQCDERAVVKVVIPHCIERIAAGIARTDELRVLRFVFRDDDRAVWACRLAYAGGDFGDDVCRRGIEDLLSRIEPEAVEVKFFDPVRRVARKELAHRRRPVSVEVERLTPLRAPLEVVFTKLLEIIAIGTEMVVHDVEDDAEAVGVCVIDEGAEVVGSAVVMVRSE